MINKGCMVYVKVDDKSVFVAIIKSIADKHIINITHINCLDYSKQ